MTTPVPRTVFVSYSHDSVAHKRQVQGLVERLRDEGVDCNLDVYEEAPPEGWPAWMDRQIRESDYVLVVCTEVYNRRVRGRESAGIGLGARWEGGLITQALYDAGGRNEKFIPVVFAAEDVKHIPEFLRGATRYEVFTVEGYERLYRRLTAQPRFPKRPLGKLRRLPPEGPSPAPRAAKSTRGTRQTKNSSTATRRPRTPTRDSRQRGEAVLIARDNLQPRFPIAISVEASDSIQMVLAPKSGDERAFLDDLARRTHDSVSIAYGLTAVRARITSVKHVREAGADRYHLAFALNEKEYGSATIEMSTSGYSADDIAALRARRILLDERRPAESRGLRAQAGDSMLEALVQGLNGPLSVERSPLPELYQQFGAVGKADFLVAARLVAVLWLRFSGTVEHVLELDMKLRKSQLSVHFRGVRYKTYSNRDPVAITVVGTCPLT